MRRRRCIPLILSLALFVCYSYAPHADTPFVATFINVGQADCCWLHLPNGDDVLVDGGKPHAGPTVVAYLQQHGVTDIDLMVATHGDADHIGALLDVLASMPVYEAWLDSQTCTTGTCQDFYQALIDNGVVTATVRMGETYQWGEVTALVLNPSEPLYASKNENSIVLRVSHGSVDFLLTGDAETGAEGRMLGSGLSLDAEILKVGHHGSNSSSSAQFLNALAPSEAIISVGPNPYRHPGAEVLQRLAGVGANVYRTDLDGTVTVTSNGVTWTVITQNPCQGDANGDGVVDVLDLVIVAVAYNPHGPVSDPRADVNGDSVVDLFDLVLVTRDFGRGSSQPVVTSTSTPCRTRTPTVVRTRTPAPTRTWTPTVMPTPTRIRTPTQWPPAQANVIIRYIFYDGVVPRVESDEYAEIANQGIAPVNLRGWRLNAGDPGQDFIFPYFLLQPGQACRVYTNEVHPETGGFTFSSGRAIWNNKGDCGYLYDAAGQLVSQYCY